MIVKCFLVSIYIGTRPLSVNIIIRFPTKWHLNGSCKKKLFSFSTRRRQYIKKQDPEFKFKSVTWTWRLFNAAWTALKVLSANDGETLRECGRDACVGRWGEFDRGERSLKKMKGVFLGF